MTALKKVCDNTLITGIGQEKKEEKLDSKYKSALPRIKPRILTAMASVLIFTYGNKNLECAFKYRNLKKRN